MTQESDFDILSFLPYLLNQAAEASSLEFQQIYKARYGMLRTEWRVLFHLGHFGALTARDICTRANLHKTKVSRAVQKLSERRYLARRRNETDRRSEQLTLTPLGQTVYLDLSGVAQNYDRQLMQALTPDEARNLRAALQKLAGLR